MSTRTQRKRLEQRRLEKIEYMKMVRESNNNRAKEQKEATEPKKKKTSTKKKGK